MGTLASARAWIRAHPGAVTVIETVALLATGLLSLLVQMRTDDVLDEAGTIPGWLAVSWMVALLVPYVVRRRFPLAAMVAIGVVFTGFRLWMVPEYVVSGIVMFLVIVFAGRDGGARRGVARAGIVSLIGVMFVITVITQELPEEYRPLFRWSLVSSVVYNAFFVAAAWLLGDALHRRRERERELWERTTQLEAERELNARRAVVDERLRIARELHDVVAHHVSVMGVQAGAARRMIDRDPQRAVTALATVEGSSRQAVDELRRLVGLLREQDGVSLEPAPGLDRVERLLDETRLTGIDVGWQVEGEAVPIPDSVGLSIYRVVQEALTNTLKHAHATRVDVTMRYAAEAVEVEVADNGVGIAPPGTAGSGHGLVGMRERVALHDGALDARPDRRGGFCVRARFPAPPAQRVPS